MADPGFGADAQALLLRARSRGSVERARRTYPTLDEVVSEARDLAPLPAIAAQVLAISEHDEFSMQQLSMLISGDQALSAKLLRIANSAFHGHRRRIGTVRDALILLGFRTARAAAVAACLIRDGARGRATTNLDYPVFWRHSLSVAVLSEMLGRSDGTLSGEAVSEQAFTAGVLHDIGRLALDQFVPYALGDAIHLARQAGCSLQEAQRSLFHFTDAELGAAFAEHWNFPPAVVEALRRMDDTREPAGPPRGLAALVLEGRAVAAALGIARGIPVLDAPAEAGTEPAAAAGPAPPGPLAIAGSQALQEALARIGGREGLQRRVDAFLSESLGEGAGAPRLLTG